MLCCAVQNKICDDIVFPPNFPLGPAFNLSKGVFTAANIAFQPKTTYVQQTLDYSSVQPLYNAVAAYAATKGLTLANRGEAHITVRALCQILSAALDPGAYVVNNLRG